MGGVTSAFLRILVSTLRRTAERKSIKHYGQTRAPLHVRRTFPVSQRKGRRPKVARTDIPAEAGAIPEKAKSRVVTFRPQDFRDTFGTRTFGTRTFGTMTFGTMTFGIRTFGTMTYGTMTFGTMTFGIWIFGTMTYGTMTFGTMTFGTMTFGTMTFGTMAWGHAFHQKNCGGGTAGPRAKRANPIPDSRRLILRKS